MYAGRRVCGLKLNELAKAAGMDNYKAVAAAIARYEKRLTRDKAQRAMLKRLFEM